MGVGAADVDGDVVCVVGQDLEGGNIILGGAFKGGILRLAEIDAKGGWAFALRIVVGDVGGNNFGAVVVKSHAVNDCIDAWVAKDPGARVAGLAFWRNGPDLDVTEAQGRRRLREFRALVHSCSEADWIGEIQPEETNGRGLRARK